MAGFLRTLARVGLVELDGEEAATASAPEVDDAAIESILAAESAVPLEPLPAATSATQGQLVAEGQPFEAIYESASVAPSKYPAEKLLRMLDGLRAMDPGTRKAAVLAMDAADDAWTLQDAVLDAQRKMRALERAALGIDQQMEAARAKAQADVSAQETYREQATASIRQQIADLEALLEKELRQVAEERARIQNSIESADLAASREKARLNAEAERLREVPTLFGAPAPAGGAAAE
jgi:hypothetical protein